MLDDKLNKISRQIVNSEKELMNIIMPIFKETDSIRIENLELNFDFNFNEILKRYFNFASIIDKQYEELCLIVDKDIYISNIKCNELGLSLINSNSNVCFSNLEIATISLICCTFNNIKSNSTSNESVLSLNEIVITDKLFIADCVFYSNFTPQSIFFKNEASFYIEDCVFHQNVQFLSIQLQGKNSALSIEGEQSNIKGKLEFLLCILLGSVNIHCDVLGGLHFRLINCILATNPDVKSKNFNTGKLVIGYSKIYSSSVFFNCHFFEVDIIDTIFNDNLSEIDFTYEKITYEGALTLKNKAKNRGSLVLEQKHNVEIYDCMLKESTLDALQSWRDEFVLNKEINRLELIIKSVKNIFRVEIIEPIIFFIPSLFSSERLLIFFYKYSNNYGRSWLRGVIFTVKMTFLSYFIINYFGMENQFFIIDWKFNNFGEVSKGFLSIIDIFNLSKVKVNFELTAVGSYLIAISKILVAYGVYQTIHAFYKYTK